MPAKKPNSSSGFTAIEAIMKLWPAFILVGGFVVTWVRMETKVQAVEPLQAQVKELDSKLETQGRDLDKKVESIEKGQTDIKYQLEKKEIQDKAAREKINSKLDQLLRLNNQPVIIEKEKEDTE